MKSLVISLALILSLTVGATAAEYVLSVTEAEILAPTPSPSR